jgi:hypothetical protein
MSHAARSRSLSALALALACALGVGAGALGCSSKGGGADAGAPTAELTPVPAPAGHLGDLFIATPGATWAKARGTVGQPAMFLPQSFGALATTLIGLPVTIAAEIDEGVPVVGAAVRDGTGAPEVVVGLHVKAGDRFVDQVTRGEGARFNATVDATSHITRLTDKVAPERAKFALGVLGNYLLVAAKPADLDAVGPYVVRTLGAARAPRDAAAPKEDVVIDLPEKALAGPIADQIKQMRGTVDGAPVTLIPLGAMLDSAATLAGDAKGARVTLTFDDAAVHGRAAVTAKPGGAGSKLVADLAVGDVKPLLDLPDTTTLGLLWRESAKARLDNAPKQADALARLLGAGVTDEDKAAITSALRAESAARGDWQAIGVAFAGTGPTAMVRAPVEDPEAMRKALKQLVDLSNLAGFKKLVGAMGVTVTTDKVVVENLAADVTRVRLAHGDPKRGKDDKPAKSAQDAKPAKPGGKSDANPAGAANAVDLLYFVDANGLFAAAGYDPRDSLRALTKAPGGASLAGSAPVAAALKDVGAEVVFALVADVLRMDAMTSGRMPPAASTPVVLAAGRASAGAATELWARFDLPTSVVQQLVQQFMSQQQRPALPGLP